MGGRWDIEGMGRGEESTGSKCDGDVTYTCETVKEHIKIKKAKNRISYSISTPLLGTDVKEMDPYVEETSGVICVSCQYWPKTGNGTSACPPTNGQTHA